jgi:MFS superfamily sulfate permease-like transporter
LQWLPTYSAKNDLIRDVVAGLTVGVMAVPQAMSYATVAGTQPRLFAGVLVHAAFR